MTWKRNFESKYQKTLREIPLEGNSEGCCSYDCCISTDPKVSSVALGYDDMALEYTLNHPYLD